MRQLNARLTSAVCVCEQVQCVYVCVIFCDITSLEDSFSHVDLTLTLTLLLLYSTLNLWKQNSGFYSGKKKGCDANLNIEKSAASAGYAMLYV